MPSCSAKIQQSKQELVSPIDLVGPVEVSIEVKDGSSKMLKMRGATVK
jgi:hypothetical protein